MSETIKSDFLNITDKSSQIVSFNLSNEEFAIKISHIQEIIKIKPFTEVPLTKEYVKGVVHVRGVIIPVIDLGRKLGFKQNEITNYSRIIIINLSNRKIGLVVDSMNEVIRINDEDLKPKIFESEIERFTENIFTLENRIITILKIQSIADNE